MGKAVLTGRKMGFGRCEGYRVCYTNGHGKEMEKYFGIQEVKDMVLRGLIIEGVQLNDTKDELMVDSEVYQGLELIKGGAVKFVGKANKNGSNDVYRVVGSDGVVEEMGADKLWERAADGLVECVIARMRMRDGRYIRVLAFEG